MKIFKSTTSEVFDTDNPDKIECVCSAPKGIIPLHDAHDTLDHIFLSRYFPQDHRIFYCFTDSFYYAIPNSHE